MYDDINDPATRIAASIKRRHGRSQQALVPVVEALDIGLIRSNLRPLPAEQDDAPLDGYGLYTALISRLPNDAQESLRPEQVRALREACQQLRWGQHKLDCRLSIPWFGHRFYLVLIGGIERRSAARLMSERKSNTASGLIISLASLVLVLCLGIFITNAGLTF